MKWFRTIRFHKARKYVSDDTYKIICDTDFIGFFLEKAKYYQIKFIKADLDDLFECKAEFFGDKESFLCLVEDFIKRYDNGIKEFSF